MADISRAYSEVRSLPDQALQHELEQPSGMMPGYLVLSELQDRQAMRKNSGMGRKKRPSIMQEILAAMPKTQPAPQQVPGYSEGGIIQQINPFYAYLEGLQNPEQASAQMQEKINSQFHNQPPLMPLQKPGAPTAPVSGSTLRPQPAGTPPGLEGIYGQRR